jgi:hypothetical protein
MENVRTSAVLRSQPVAILAALLVVAGLVGLAVVGVLLYGQVRPGLDYYCITTTLPIPAGSDPDAAPVGSFSWFPAGISCRYPQIAGNGWAARLPGWDMSISALVAALMVLTGALRLRRQRRPKR